MLGTILFIINTADLAETGLSSHQCADDSQIYGSCLDVNTSSLSSKLSSCIDSFGYVSSWMCSNQLQLSANMTEVMCGAFTRRLSQLPTNPLSISRTLVNPVSVVRDLGVFTDSELSACTHVRRTMSRCSAALRQLRRLRRYVIDDCFQSLVVSLVHSRLDYGNFLFVGLPAYQQRRLLSVLNSNARLVFRLRRNDHVSDALSVQHWLRKPMRIDLKLAVTTFHMWHGLAPP
jgi:hypothetical protein